jgi:hypothetical protein
VSIAVPGRARIATNLGRAELCRSPVSALAMCPMTLICVKLPLAGYQRDRPTGSYTPFASLSAQVWQFPLTGKWDINSGHGG